MNCELCGKPDCGRLLPESLTAECPYCFSILCCNCVDPTEEDPTPETDSIDTEYEDPEPGAEDEPASLFDLLMQAMDLIQRASNGEYNDNAEVLQNIGQLQAVVLGVVSPVLHLAHDADFDQAPEADPVSMGC